MFSRDSFLVDVVPDDGGLRVRLTGELDIATAPELARVLDAAMAANPPRIIVDVGGVTFVDLFGLRALVDAKQRAEMIRAEFWLQGVSDWTRRVIRLARFAELDAVADRTVGNEG